MYDSVRCLIVPNEIILDVMTKIYGSNIILVFPDVNCYEDPVNCDDGNGCKINSIHTHRIPFTDYVNPQVTNDQCMANHVFNLLIHNHCTNDIWFTNGYCISGHVKDCIDCSDTANITSKICNIQVFVLLTGIYKISLFFVQVCKINSILQLYSTTTIHSNKAAILDLESTVEDLESILIELTNNIKKKEVERNKINEVLLTKEREEAGGRSSKNLLSASVNRNSSSLKSANNSENKEFLERVEPCQPQQLDFPQSFDSSLVMGTTTMAAAAVEKTINTSSGSSIFKNKNSKQYPCQQIAQRLWSINQFMDTAAAKNN
ncbi:hypothetical protein ACTA71_001881 [Dictyostelium dimigraforme]